VIWKKSIYRYWTKISTISNYEIRKCSSVSWVHCSWSKSKQGFELLIWHIYCLDFPVSLDSELEKELWYFDSMFTSHHTVIVFKNYRSCGWWPSVITLTLFALLNCQLSIAVTYAFSQLYRRRFGFKRFHIVHMRKVDNYQILIFLKYRYLSKILIYRINLANVLCWNLSWNLFETVLK
jgi:hypothetical protein